MLTMYFWGFNILTNEVTIFWCTNVCVKMLSFNMKINRTQCNDCDISIEINIQTIFKMRGSIENFLSKTKMWDINGQ